MLHLDFLLAVAVLTAAPLDVSDQKQLFIDHRFIAESENVDLHANAAQKLGLISDENGQPLQGHISRVIEDQGKIRLYLGADGLTVLESDDAQHFHRRVRYRAGTFPRSSSIRTTTRRGATSCFTWSFRRRSIPRSTACLPAIRPTA